MKQSKKKRSRPQKRKQEAPSPSENSKDEEIRVLKNLTEAFADVSIEDLTAAYRSANGDPNRAAEILVISAESAEIGSTSTSTSSKVFSSDSYGCSSSSSNSSSTGFKEEICEGFRGVKAKKVVAATGMVSSFLGKDYVRSTPKKESYRDKGFHDEPLNKGDSEQFLCSMLGDECELSLAVVRDVLCQCRYDLDRALNVLLELSGSSCQQPNHGDFQEHSLRRKREYLLESTENVTDRASDSTSFSSENECQESIWNLGNTQRRNYSQVLTGTMEHPSPPSPKVSVSELPQKVLESLFNTPPKSSQHEPNSMNWRNVVKKMESLGQSFDPPTNSELQKIERDKGEEYRVYRESAKQHWDSMKSCYQKATTAYTNGERQYATYLSEQGRLHNKMAREADERASQNIFTARNKSIENMITIDLHGQHVKQAMRLLKLHLLFGAYVRSVRLFKVITGCGSHGVGKSKLKQSVMNLLEKEGVEWKEENRGTLLITLHGNREFTFLDTDSDTD